MKLTQNQKMFLGAAALVGVAVFLYNRNKSKNGGTTNQKNGEGESNFTARRAAIKPVSTRGAYTQCLCDNGSRCQSKDGSCGCCSGRDYEILK